MEVSAKFTLDKVTVKSQSDPRHCFGSFPPVFDLKVHMQHGDLHEGRVGRQSRPEQRSQRTHRAPEPPVWPHTPHFILINTWNTAARSVRGCAGGFCPRTAAIEI